MGLPPLEAFSSVAGGFVALALGMILIAVGRVFRMLWIACTASFSSVLPARLAMVVGLALAIAFTWGLTSGVIERLAVEGLDRAYARLDALLPPSLAATSDALKSGSAASLVTWASLGAQGRRHMLARPNRPEIEALVESSAKEPIRGYVGLNAAGSAQARAELAVAELRRTGAFERGALVIATPTGTGWVNPAATAPMEYLLHGDVATISMQYSYLPSWLSLLVEPERGAETARAVYRVIWSYWASLPETQRPKLYLFRLSLGAFKSDLAVDLYDILAAPHQGAFWVGPPFQSRTWRQVSATRNEGSPVWAPQYSDGRMFRFMTQDGFPAKRYADWGPVRVVYVQYPSDPIVVFDMGSVWRRPQIAENPRPSDIAADSQWFPVLSFVQMVVDMMTATQAPHGFGHVYTTEHYLRGWLTLLEPHGWQHHQVETLRRHLATNG